MEAADSAWFRYAEAESIYLCKSRILIRRVSAHMTIADLDCLRADVGGDFERPVW